MARQIERRCSRAGFSVNVVCAPSVPLSFEVSVSGKVVHSKLNGQGFISTKEMEGKYSFNQERLTLTGKGTAYKLDQVIHVRLKQVDWSRKQLNFDIVENDSSVEA